jgi:hypothetical protein
MGISENYNNLPANFGPKDAGRLENTDGSCLGFPESP